MKNTLLTPKRLPRKNALDAFGGTPKAVVSALEYGSSHAVSMWPDVLSLAVSDRVRGAALRLGLLKLDLTPEPEPRPARPMKRTRWLAPRGGRSA